MQTEQEKQEQRKKEREQKRADYEKQKQAETQAKQLVDLLCKAANDSTFKGLFEQTLEREHRTHQQTITSFLLGWFVHLAKMKQKDAFDLRNEAAVKLGWTIVQKVLAPDFGYDNTEEFLKHQFHRLLPYL